MLKSLYKLTCSGSTEAVITRKEGKGWLPQWWLSFWKWIEGKRRIPGRDLWVSADSEPLSSVIAFADVSHYFFMEPIILSHDMKT